MPETLLQTKLYVPPSRPNLVPRPHLIERLNRGLQLGQKLTLISAPAGFGKTTLVSEWIGSLSFDAAKENRIANRIAWLSLDEGDNDPARFLAYFVAALGHVEGIDITVGKGASSMLQSPQPPPAEDVLTSLINDIAAVSDRIILVLDDYHLITSPAVDEALVFLLEHLPRQLHLVIATRDDPQLPLARLRARWQLTETRAAELRFSAAEAAHFLNQVMGLNLSESHISALEARTEGWIAGLQLAALALHGHISVQGHEDVTGFIKSFSGSHHFVLDYLIEEVLDQQSTSVQRFLLQTAVLERMTGSLCDALTGQDSGQATLELLDHANLFIVPLDNERLWYRYHHLFADLLRQRLRQIHLEQIPTLHSRASDWYEQNDLPSAAIHHALAAEDFERAADLAELAWRAMDMGYKSVAWLGWVKALPDELVRARPALSTGYGWALVDSGEPEAAEYRLRDAERWLDSMASVNEQPEISTVKIVALDEEEFRSLSISVANARAYLCQALGDVPGTVKYAQRALDLLLEDDYFERGLSAILLGFAYWASGDLDAAYKAVTNAISNMQMAGKILHIISFTSYLADIMTAQGRLYETARTYLQLLEIATEQGEAELQETAVLHLGLSEIYHEQGDLQSARRHLLRSEELGEQATFPPWYRHWVLAQTRIKMAQGNLDGVIKMLNEAESLYYKHPIPDVRPLTALITRAWLTQGRLTKALGWVRERGLFINDDLSYLREFEHVTLARVLIAQYKRGGVDDSIHEAMEIVDRLLVAAEEGRRMGSIIEILVLQALAYEAQGKIPSALMALERALTLAEPEGYVRIFVDEGQPMEGLLVRMKDEGGRMKEYVDRLLTTFKGQKDAQRLDSVQDKPLSLNPQSLVEPLSERELEVLQLIAEGLTNREIAERLFLSLNTIKVHSRNIYGKLGVNSRTQAVNRARDLGVLPRS